MTCLFCQSFSTRLLTMFGGYTAIRLYVHCCNLPSQQTAKQHSVDSVDSCFSCTFFLTPLFPLNLMPCRSFQVRGVWMPDKATVEAMSSRREAWPHPPFHGTQQENFQRIRKLSKAWLCNFLALMVFQPIKRDSV